MGTSDQTVVNVIEVQHEKACTRCGNVNFCKLIKMNKEEFDRNRASDPDVYWNEIMGDKILHRKFETHKSANCPRSC